MSQLPKTDPGRVELAINPVRTGVITRDEMLAFLDGMTLKDYLLPRTKLGKLLAGKDE